jgi:hypothetical protein
MTMLLEMHYKKSQGRHLQNYRSLPRNIRQLPLLEGGDPVEAVRREYYTFKVPSKQTRQFLTYHDCSTGAGLVSKVPKFLLFLSFTFDSKILQFYN